MKLAPPKTIQADGRSRARHRTKRLVATTYAEWQARPEGQRTQAALEAALADAQRAFNSGTQQ